jgi:cell division protein ZapA
VAQVEIQVGGRSYPVSCRDGEEERLRLLARLIDTRADHIARAIGRGNEARELLMTALLLADELDETRNTVAALESAEAERTAAVARCAARIDAVAAALENGTGSA